MRGPERIERILEKIGRLWHKWPDLRFCQLVENVMSAKGHCIFYVEDDDFEKYLDGWLDVMKCEDGN